MIAQNVIKDKGIPGAIKKLWTKFSGFGTLRVGRRNSMHTRNSVSLLVEEINYAIWRTNGISATIDGVFAAVFRYLAGGRK